MQNTIRKVRVWFGECHECIVDVQMGRALVGWEPQRDEVDVGQDLEGGWEDGVRCHIGKGFLRRKLVGQAAEDQQTGEEYVPEPLVEWIFVMQIEMGNGC